MRTSWSITTGPQIEPVTTTEVAAHLRIGSTEATAEASYLSALITAARQVVERSILHRALIDTIFAYKMDKFPITTITLPFPPLQTVTSIKYYDANNALQTLGTDYYQVDTASEPGEIVVSSDHDYPDTYERIDAVTVAYKAGYGDEAADVPRAIRQAILMVVGTMYENRESVVGTAYLFKHNPAATALLSAYQIRGLH